MLFSRLNLVNIFQIINFTATIPLHLRLNLYKTIMKISVVFLFLISSTFAFSQKMYSVDYSNQSDLKVYVVKYENQADLKVYKVKYANQAGKNDGKWFFTEYANQAEKKIYFVDYENQADLKVFFVEYENQAGWRNKSKMQLLF